jgi:hypothetical protein
MTTFAIARGGTSPIGNALTRRWQNRRGHRRASADRSGPDRAVGDGGGYLDWFGSHHSGSDHANGSNDCSSSGMQAAAIAVEAAMTAAAINITSPQTGTCIWCLRHRDFRPIPVCVSPQFGIT